MPTGSENSQTVTVDRDARLLREAFSRCRRSVDATRDDTYARNLVKRVDAGRVRVAEHVVTLAWDGFSRGARQDDVEAFGQIYLAIVRGWYAASRRGLTVRLPELVREVLEAQGRATVAEFTILTERSPKAIADAEEALTTEELAIERELEVLRSMRYVSEAA
jgi:hypothetical protein